MSGLVWTLTLICIGAVAGSFAATAILRLRRGEQPLSGRSHCDGCGVTLGYAETLPIISYLTRHGACAACGARINPAHLVGEIAGAGIALMVILAGFT